MLETTPESKTFKYSHLPHFLNFLHFFPKIYMDWCYFQIIASVLLNVNYDLCMVHKSSCMLFRAVGITTKLLRGFCIFAKHGQIHWRTLFVLPGN